MKHIILGVALCISWPALAQETYLKVTSDYDLQDDSMDLDAPKDFKVDEPFVDKYYVDFRIFINTDEYTVCYVGDTKEAAEIAQSVLDVSTGDSYILESTFKVDGSTIVHEGTYTEGSGDYDFELNFEVPECK